jgi:hypothetical protein
LSIPCIYQKPCNFTVCFLKILITLPIYETTLVPVGIISIQNGNQLN